MADSLSGDKQPTPAGSSRPRRRGWRRVGFPLLAVAVGLAPFVLIEAALRLFDENDSGGERAYVDPLVGFSRLTPLFELDRDAGLYRTARSRQLSFGTQEFRAKKPAEGFRVFCLGGSTVRGRPYTTQTAFPAWLQMELAGADPNRSYEVINCGGLSYASYRLTRILDEVLQYEPDLIVIASGHNEFLEDRTYSSIKSRSAARAWVEDRLYSLRTVRAAARIWRDASVSRDPAGERADTVTNGAKQDDAGRSILPDEVSPRLDEASGYASYHRDDAWRAGVIEHFERSVRAMISMCRQKQVPVVLVALGSNLRDCPPFKSEHKPGLPPEQERDWQAAFDAATHIGQKNPEQALRHYRRAEAIDAEHALLHYRIARCLDRLGRPEDAGTYYLRAKELDVCPLRMPDETYGLLKTIAGETRVPLVDARRLFEQQSADGIAGYEWYVDHVHPTIGAHQQIARAIGVELRKLDRPAGGISAPDTASVRGTRPRRDAECRAAYRREFERLGPVYLVNGRERLRWLEKWSRRQRLYEETLPDGPRSHLAHGFRRLDLGEEKQAWEHFAAALAVEQPDSGSSSHQPGSWAARGLLKHALVLFQQGRPGVAFDLLDWLRGEAAAAALAVNVDLALLVVALERDDAPTATAIFRRRQAEFEQFTPETNGWLAAMPDALRRCRRALELSE